MRAFGLSEAGPVRRMNEDRFISAQDLQLFIVADGMGGHAAGEVAANVAVESIENFIRRSHETSDVSWPFGIDPALSFDANRLKTAVNLANRRINRLAENHDDYLAMATTVVCALVANGHLVAAHVGDSRLYLRNAEGLHQLTEDDSWAATVLGGKGANGGTPAVRHVLTNVLGARPDTLVHLQERELAGTDLLLLCSDGLHGAVPHDRLHELTASTDDLERLPHRLITAALEHGSRDNITVLVVGGCGDWAGNGH
ncbi:MAG TPA: protein phosphatase 2C domain-containing protein [Vicinamibacterales bacterium]|nr:protein phosphatase 2C domain-containing protein [Vicinamibacterales bacterium]